MDNIIQVVENYLLPSKQRRLILRMIGKNHFEGVIDIVDRFLIVC